MAETPAMSLKICLRTAAVAGMMMMPSLAAAQSLPAPWEASNIGRPMLSGSAESVPCTPDCLSATVAGAGLDVGGTGDQFMFVHHALTGDGAIVARVVDVEHTHSAAKAGVMIRESLTAQSPHAFLAVTAAHGVVFQRRLAAAGTTTQNYAGAQNAPVWLKVERRAAVLTAYRSPDGTAWTEVGRDTVPMADTLYVGLAVTSHNGSALAEASFTNAAVRDLTLPDGWLSADIGGPALRGAATFQSGTFTVTGAGTDIYYGSDQFRYAYRRADGDVDIVARLRSLEYANAWTKAGVMIRASLAANAAHGFMLVSPSMGLSFQRRRDNGLLSIGTDGGAGKAPVWVKLQRRGAVITAFRSADGINWTMVGSDTIVMPSSFYVGLAVTSHDAQKRVKAVFDAVAVSVRPANTAPVVSLVAPEPAHVGPASIDLAAHADDNDGRVARVEFYAGSTHIGADTSEPFGVTWADVAPGSYVLTAIAYDEAGAASTSAPAVVTVQPRPRRWHVQFEPTADHDTNVDSYVVEILAAGHATPVVVWEIGKPTRAAAGAGIDITGLVAPLPYGTYVARVNAVNVAGTAVSVSSAGFLR